MFKPFKDRLNDLAHIFYPHVCAGCGTDILADVNLLCATCFTQLPVTGFMQFKGNVIEKIFYGRLNLQQAGSAFYFTKDSLIQQLAVQLKYRGSKDTGIYLGKQLGIQLQQSQRFNDVDIIIPLPLNPVKQRKRGYNQAEEISKGIAAVWIKPVVTNAVTRTIFTETQTHKTRISRWQTMEDAFAVSNSYLLQDKHILLVDDIITTGATLEACGHAILKVPGTKLSVAAAAYTI